ncbi:MAG: ribonuclease Z [Muribaculaceae bacterium]|nr:ribonuclease Z [Muribaculaceae bacterium]
MAKFQLNILGCGSAKPTPRHNPSSQVINFRDNLFMIDCGEGTQSMMLRMGLNLNRLNHIFISHLHGDHCFGLPGLVSTMALQGKGGTLTIHINKDGAKLFGDMFNYFCRECPFEIKFNIIEYGDNIIYEDNSIVVRTIPLKHRVPTVGFLFEEKPKMRHINREMTDYFKVPVYKMDAIRNGEDFVLENGEIIANSRLTKDADPCIKYAYCSDTMLTDKYIPTIKDVDWLYHEATYDNANEKNARSRYHSTTTQAAEAAIRANAKNLIIGHFSSRYHNEELLLQEARAVFPNTILANEGLKIDFI